MTSMTFLINDTIDATAPVVRVNIAQNADGTVTFTLTQLSGYVGDLRGLFFDVADSSLLGSLVIAGAGITDYAQGDNSIVDLGGGSNVNGLLGKGEGFDVGLEIGTSGIGSDDYRTISFTLAGSRPLTLADFSNVKFGARLTSVGLDANLDGTFESSRSGSSKTGEVTFGVAAVSADTASVTEDGTLSGNVLSNDGGAGSTMAVMSWTGGALGQALSFSQLHNATVKLNGDGSYEVDASAADSLRAGQSVSQAFTYQVQQTNVDGTSTQTVSFTVTITGTNDAPAISAATNPAAVAESSGASDAQDLSALHGTISISDLDVGDTLTLSVAGNATALYNGAAVPVDASVDLTALVASGAISFDALTSNGAQQTIGWHYDPAAADLDWLRAGDTLTLTYVAQVNDGAGNVGAQNLVITITGTNDGPVLSDTTNPGAVAEAVDASAQNLDAINGSFVVTDADLGDTLTASVVGSPTVLLDGSAFTLPAGAAALTASSAFALTGATSTGGATSIGYSYDPGAANLDFLRAGQSLTIAYSVKVNDGTADSATQDVVFTITGSDDAPTLAAVTSGSVSEVDQSAATIEAGLSGTLAGTDLDGETLTYGIQDGTPGAPGTVTKAGTYGTLAVNTSSGAYNYVKNAAAIEGLDAGEGGNDVFTVTVTDGDGALVTQTYTVAVIGADDAPTLAAVTSGSVVEIPQSTSTTDTGLAGTLAGDDVDVETLTYGIQDGTAGSGTVSKVGTYGTLTVTTATGAYSYAKNAAAIEALNAGQSASDVFTVTVSDGDGALVTQTYTVEVTGAGDGPVIASLPSAFTNAGDPNDFDNIVTGPPSGSASSGNDVIVGTSGEDSINAMNGNDLVYGMDGADRLMGGGGTDTIYGGAGGDTINGNNAADVIYGGSGNDTISGNNDEDEIYGGSGADTIDGGGENDTIIGGYGADTMTGDVGNDTFKFLSLLDTNDTITDFSPGSDKLDLSAIASGDADGAFNWGGQTAGATVAANSVTWHATGGNTVVLVDNDGDLSDAEFMITLTGLITLSQGDFVL